MPSLSVFEISALDVLVSMGGLDSEIEGSKIRGALSEIGIEKNASVFSRSMAKLEKIGMLKGRCLAERIDETTVRKKFFRASEQGIDALKEARQFFVQLNWGEERPCDSARFSL